MTAVTTVLLALIGLAEGVVVGAAVVAFLTVLGIIPRLAHLTGSTASIRLYESTVIIGTMTASFAGFFDVNLRLPAWAAAVVGGAMGIFVGMISSALAEVLNVIPAFARHLSIQAAVRLLITALLLGKVVGALIYWLVPGLW